MVWVCFLQFRASLSSPPIAGVHVHAVQVIEVVVIVVIIIVVVAVDNINQIQNCVDWYHCESQKTKQCKMLNFKQKASLNVLLKHLKGENVEVDGQEDDLSWNSSLIVN